MPHALHFPLTQRNLRLLSTLLTLLPAGFLLAQNPPAPASPRTQEAPAKTGAANSPQAPANAAKTEEISTRDTPTTFKVRVNLVLVRVVVRDTSGKVITNLKKENFQVFDNRKPQVISSFSVETPETHVPVTTTASSPSEASPVNPSAAAAIAALPKRFVGLVFDDTNMLMEDTNVVRDAASRLFGALAPSDRVAINTTSGQLTRDFTDDRDTLKQSLLGIVPRPVAGAKGFHDCPEVSFYQADLIVNKQDPQALDVATEDALQCAFGGDSRMRDQARSMAFASAGRALNEGESQIEYTYRHLEDAMRRLANMPGQRIMVLVSPGFLVTTLTQQSSELVDRANRSGIVINTIDARGLYAPDLAGDISDPPRDSFKVAGYKASYRIAGQAAQNEILAQLADGTGGTFFHNRNDIDEGMREAVAAPGFSYLLGFSPQNLKIDGKYHTLKVTLNTKDKFSVQARHGYFAPRTIADPAEAAKEEIQEALFSQEELRDLPVELQTQFFKKDSAEARLAVLTHVDIKGVHFRKAEGRNHDNLTVATAIFDENGNLVTGGEKVVEMRLLDKTFERLSRSGFTLKSSFDIKPGTYLVRTVVRDSEGAQMAARNGAVSIPF